MLVRVRPEELDILRDLEVQTYQETFGPFIKQEDLEYYFVHELARERLAWELANPGSEHYFVLDKEQKSLVFSSVTGGRLRQSRSWKIPLKFNEFMYLPPIRASAWAKKCLNLPWKKPKNVVLAGLG